MIRRTYYRSFTTPDAEVIRLTLPDLGAALHHAAIDLSHDCTVERIDALLARLKDAETSLMHLRRALVQATA